MRVLIFSLVVRWNTTLWWLTLLEVWSFTFKLLLPMVYRLTTGDKYCGGGFGNYLKKHVESSLFQRVKCSSVVLCTLMVLMGHWIDHSWWTHWAISHSSQCTTAGVGGYGLCFPVCGMVHIKDTLLLMEKNSPWSGYSGFSLSLSEWSHPTSAQPTSIIQWLSHQTVPAPSQSRCFMTYSSYWLDERPLYHLLSLKLLIVTTNY